PSAFRDRLVQDEQHARERVPVRLRQETQQDGELGRVGFARRAQAEAEARARLVRVAALALEARRECLRTGNEGGIVQQRERLQGRVAARAPRAGELAARRVEQREGRIRRRALL